MPDITATLQVPDPLVPSLLHIGAQKVTRLTVQNPSTHPVSVADIGLHIPGLSVEPVCVPISRVDPGKEIIVKAIAFPLERLNRMYLETQQQRDDGLPCELVATGADGQVIGTRPVQILPPNAWAYAHYPEALAAFVNKESRAVQEIVQRARPYLRTLLGVTSFAEALNLPLQDARDRERHMAAALYQCLLESYQIHWEYEPRTYDAHWQKIRFHERVLGERQGTCIDFALLFLACLESIHLDALLVLIRTSPNVQHALVGCWRDRSRARSAVLRQRQYQALATWLSPACGTGDLLLWDPTGFSVEHGWPFSTACREGFTCVAKAGPSNFRWAVDIAHARRGAGKRPVVSPMPFGDGPHLNAAGWNGVHRAEELAKHMRYDIIERAHLALALLVTAPELSQELFGDEAPKLQSSLAARLRQKLPAPRNVRIVSWTRSLHERLKRAGALAEQHGAGLISPVQLFHAVLEDPGQSLQHVLTEVGIDTRTAIQALIHLAHQDPQRNSYVESQAPHP